MHTLVRVQSRLELFEQHSGAGGASAPRARGQASSALSARVDCRAYTRGKDGAKGGWERKK